MALPSLGPKPRYLEELRVGGGYGSLPDGGVDIDKTGRIAADGDLTVDGALDARGGITNTTASAVVCAVGMEVRGALRTALGGCDKTWSAWLSPHAGIKSSTAPPSGPNTTWSGNFSGSYTSLDFNQSTRQFASWAIALPADYDGGALKLTLFWTASGGTAGHNVVWRVRLGAMADNADPTALLTDVGSTVDDTLQTTGHVHIVTTPAGTPLNAAGGGLLLINIDRQADAVTDTLAADAKLIGARVWYA